MRYYKCTMIYYNQLHSQFHSHQLSQLSQLSPTWPSSLCACAPWRLTQKGESMGMIPGAYHEDSKITDDHSDSKDSQSLNCQKLSSSHTFFPPPKRQRQETEELLLTFTDEQTNSNGSPSPSARPKCLSKERSIEDFRSKHQNHILCNPRCGS